jgi:hypothetical protein
MKEMIEATSPTSNWPPETGRLISFKSGDRWETGVLKEVRWGLVWRDFILDDGRVIPEIKVLGCPHPQVWREISEVTQAEREAWEERLATMAAAGQDPREREQSFRAELNQYLAYTYLRFRRAGNGLVDAERKPDDVPERIKEVKRVVTGRLGELLEVKSGPEECESAAHSLGRLKDLETSLQIAGPQFRRLSST